MINNPMDVIETGWDLGVVWPLFKMYERINQAGSYAGAAFLAVLINCRGMRLALSVLVR